MKKHPHSITMNTTEQHTTANNQPVTPAPQPEIKLLTRRQVATRWAACPRTVARTKELKPIYFNSRRLRYRLTDVEAVERQAAGIAA